MGIADILCDYIYTAFLVIKASAEVIVKSAKRLLEDLDTLYNTILSLCQLVIDVGIESLLNFTWAISNIITDNLLNFDYNSICQGLFKCPEFLEQIVNPNSLLSRTIRKYTNYDTSLQEAIYDTLGDYNQFKDQICSFGLSYDFGMEAIREMLEGWQKQASEFMKLCQECKENIRRHLQKYLDYLIDSGVFDMLDKLKNFFDCVLVDTDICSNIYTANSYYNTVLSKLHIKATGNSYALDDDIQRQYMNSMDSRINQLNNSKKELTEMVQSVCNPRTIQSPK